MLHCFSVLFSSIFVEVVIEVDGLPQLHALPTVHLYNFVNVGLHQLGYLRGPTRVQKYIVPVEYGDLINISLRTELCNVFVIVNNKWSRLVTLIYCNVFEAHTERQVIG